MVYARNDIFVVFGCFRLKNRVQPTLDRPSSNERRREMSLRAVINPTYYRAKQRTIRTAVLQTLEGFICQQMSQQ